MKLELKHLAPYLPHKLKALSIDGFSVSILGVDFSTNRILNINGDRTFTIAEIKPLLRPLSDLTKEIEIGGKKFVPITELAKIYETEEIFGHLKFEIKYDFAAVKYVDSEENNIIFCYNFKTKSFGTHDFDNKIIHTVQNQLDLFQKLFEWHFDVFGLIDQGLALPLI